MPAAQDMNNSAEEISSIGGNCPFLQLFDRDGLKHVMGSAKFKRERADSQLEKQNHVPPLFSALCSLEKSDFERLISQVSGGFQLDLFIQIASRGAHYDRKFDG